MFSKINFQGDQQAVESLAFVLKSSLVPRAKVRRRATPRFGMSPASVNVKFEPYCDAGTGFAMTKVDMAWGA